MSDNFFLQQAPFVVPTTDGKLIEEHVGRTVSDETNLSVAHMVAPPGWSEPHQNPEFDEYTLMVRGRKQIEINGETVTLKSGESLLVRKGVRVKYSNPFEEEADTGLYAFRHFLLNRLTGKMTHRLEQISLIVLAAASSAASGKLSTLSRISRSSELGIFPLLITDSITCSNSSTSQTASAKSSLKSKSAPPSYSSGTFRHMIRWLNPIRYSPPALP